MKYIIGLGNPGKEYENTRHNSGRLFVQYLQKRWGLPAFEENKKWQALSTKGKHEDLGLVTLILPETMMNKSGAIFRHMNAKPKDVIVAHDDADILFGAFKISFDKRSAGHKGVESVTRALKTKAYWRMRIGIQPHFAKASRGKQKKRVDAMKLVLQAFMPTEKKALSTIFKEAEKRLAAI